MLPLLAILGNATQKMPFQNFWNFSFTDSIIAVSAAIALGFGIYTTKKWQSRQTEIADRQYQLTALMEIFRIMNDKVLKDDRKKLYFWHNEGKYERKLFAENFEDLRANLDMMGILYASNAVPRESLLEMYWFVIIHCWISLERYITDVRKEDNLPVFSRPFEILKDTALEHHKKYYETHRLPA